MPDNVSIDIGKKLKTFFRDKGITQTQAAEALGVSQAYVGSMLNGKPFGKKTALIWQEKFGIQSSWLLTGEGSMLKGDEPNAAKIPLADANIMLVPLVSQYAYAGYLAGFADTEYIETLPTVPFLVDSEHKGQYVCFEVKGDSMDDNSINSYPEGAIVLGREVRQDFWKCKLHIKDWDFVIVHREKGIVIKQITEQDVENGIITCHSLNSMYDDFELHLKDVSQIFNVVKKILPARR
jgi:phage repressor protein C with HTH and peptisase S24 domain